MSLVDAITGSIAQIIVASGHETQEFSIHKKLLCDSSTYFKAALTNGFAETRDQKITLDDESPVIFRTFAACLYEKKLDEGTMPSGDQKEDVQKHMLELYVFADKRGITSLANDTITMIASSGRAKKWFLDDIGWHFPLLSPGSQLYQLFLDNLVLEFRDRDIRPRLVTGDLPRTALVDLLFRNKALSTDFDSYTACFESVCHYHLHGQQGGMSKDECIRRIEAGDNVWSSDIDLEQCMWKWD